MNIFISKLASGSMSIFLEQILRSEITGLKDSHILKAFEMNFKIFLKRLCVDLYYFGVFNISLFFC